MSRGWFNRNRIQQAHSSVEDNGRTAGRGGLASRRTVHIGLAATSVVAAAAVLASPVAGLLGGSAGPAGLAASVEAKSAASGLPPAQTFSYTGSPQSVIVPAGAVTVAVTVIGGGGGSAQSYGWTSGTYSRPGGSGAQVQAQVPVTPGQQLNVLVGGAGVSGYATDSVSAGGWGATGQGGTGANGNGTGQNGNSGGVYNGGGGGGASAIETAGQPVIVAGGGGGAGGGGLFGSGGNGGSAGSTASGGQGGSGTGSGGGGAGAAMPQGAGGPGGTTSVWNSAGSGGGGGAGYRGGNGGGGGRAGGGGGGGGGAGSSYVASQAQAVSISQASSSLTNGQVDITWQNLPQMNLSASTTKVDQGTAPVLTVDMPADATGYVGFYDTAQPGTDKGIGTAPIIDGVAILAAPTRPLPAGDNPIRASYGGDDKYSPNDSNLVTVTVKPAAPMSLSALPAQVVWGQGVLLSVNMPKDATGTVGFYDLAPSGTSTLLGTAGIGNGVAWTSLSSKRLVVGDNTIQAYYAGDGTYAPNESNLVTVSVTKAQPAVGISASTTQVVEGQAPVLTAHLPGDATGSVGFYNSALSGSDQGIGTAPIIDGIATLTAPTRPLLLGQNPVSAYYGGDQNYAANGSNPVTINVTP